MPRHTSISANVVSFARFLRHEKFSITVEDEGNALLALEAIDYHNQQVFQLALKSVFCRSANQLKQFPNLFQEYWKNRSKEIDSKTKEKTEAGRKKPPNVDPLKSLQSWLNGNRNNEEEETALYSIHENLSLKDFSNIPEDEVDSIAQAIKSISRNLAVKISRRQEKSNHNDKLNLLQTLRKNIRNGTEIVHLQFRQPKRNRTKLVLLCDVSKSMDLYSGFFIQFMYALQNTFKKTETFVFSTKLSRITSILKQNSFSEAMKSLGNEVGWGGGTKIGESLQSFLADYPKVINKQTMVIILSDGWDIGESGPIASAMHQIHSSSKKIIWLNPLAGFADYKPEAKGMQSAMPFVDVFASVHNLESLKKVGRFLIP